MREPVTGGAEARGGAPHGEPEREAFLARAGWHPIGGVPEFLHHRARRYLCTPLAERQGTVVRLLEWPGESAVPPYPVRCELHRRTSPAGEPAILLFKNGAGTREITGWRARLPLGPSVYLEDYGSGVESLEGAQGWPPRPDPPLHLTDVDEARRGAESVLDTLIRRLGRASRMTGLVRGPRGDSQAERLQRLIESSRDPRLVRRVWRGLEGLRVLDPDCRTGKWLLGCLEALAAVALACLERMKGWIEDGESGVPPLRRDVHPDFRAHLRCRDELARSGYRGRLAWEMVLLRCLRGVARDEVSARRARERLAGRVRPGGGAAEETTPAALVDVRVGLLSGYLRDRQDLPELWQRERPVGRITSRLEQDVQMLWRAEDQLIEMRLRAGGTLHSLLEGRDELRRRRAALSARLPGIRVERGCPPVMHPWIEYAGAIEAGGFHLIRGGPVNPAAMGNAGQA